jgi:hypothetical protein
VLQGLLVGLLVTIRTAGPRAAAKHPATTENVFVRPLWGLVPNPSMTQALAGRSSDAVANGTGANRHWLSSRAACVAAHNAFNSSQQRCLQPDTSHPHDHKGQRT